MTSALEFLKTVLPNQGYYCLAKPLKFIGSDGKEVSTYQHKVFETVEQLSDAARLMSDNKVDIYFAVGSLKEKQVWNEEKQKFQVRTHTNMGYYKSLFIDLDSGTKKPYKTQIEAINALRTFCKDSGFPKPTYLNSSGNGIHSYWCFDKTIASDAWDKLNTKFKATCHHFKLQADDVCFEKSRVLRVPGTFNWKNKDLPKPVTIILVGDVVSVDYITEALDRVVVENDIQIRQPKPEVPDAIKILFKDHASNLATISEVDADLIYRQCLQMQYIKDTGGPSGYGLRTCAASIIKFTHQQDYSVLWANDEKEETVRAQTDQMLGDSITDNPSTCERFESLRPDGCDNCTHRGKVKSPIVLGRRMLDLYEPADVAKYELLQTPEPVKETRTAYITVGGIEHKLAAPPYPYSHNVNGTVSMTVQDEGTSKVVPVIDFMLAPIEMCNNRSGRGDSVRIYAKVGLGEPRIIEAPTSVMCSADAMKKFLADYSIFQGGHEKSNHMYNYMVAYIKHLQRLMKPSELHSSLGWDSKDYNYFVTPTGRYNRDGTFTAATTSDSISNAVSLMVSKGTIEEWKEVINFYGRPGYEDYAFGHLIGYGSLIFPFSGLNGATVSMIGESGSGKSTILKTINSIYGDPENWLTKQDTYNAKLNRLGVLTNYPVTYDEITNIEPEELSDFLYSVSQGRGKLRLNQDSSEKSNAGSHWQMLMACTGNANLTDKLASHKLNSSAEVLRVFEYYICRRNEYKHSEAREIFEKKLHSNYGHAGNIFIAYLVQHVEEIRNLYDTTLKQVEEAAGTNQKERFWVAIVSSCIVGGIIAKELALHDFDMDAIFDWSVNQLQQMRVTVDENVRSPSNMLVDFVNQCTNRTLVLEGGTADKTGKVTPMYPTFEPTDAIWCRLEKSCDLLYIDNRKIRDYFTKGGADFNTIKRQLIDSGVLLNPNSNKVLTANSNKAKSGSTRCWLVNLAHRDMSGVLLTPVESKTVTKIEGTLRA